MLIAVADFMFLVIEGGQELRELHRGRKFTRYPEIARLQLMNRIHTVLLLK